MHGIIHSELKKFVVEKYDLPTWQLLLEKANLKNKFYLVGESYPDSEVVSLVATASEMTGIPVHALLEAFGEFIVPSLLRLYGTFVKPEWTMVEMLLNTENTIHRVVRLKNEGAKPPELNFEKITGKHLKFYYNSPRKMSAVAKGIMNGIAIHYREKIRIEEKPTVDGGVEMDIYFG